ncbi:MAG: phage tail protein [Chitinophaga sp.]|uniref:phage tail protein n=1 Tax=Chitinophaga sp. TaxID=1869181 RepID=UPI001AFD656D|nr:tail fiber protein [Chitinophaga sp.]MBO9731577.1 phage tail protein [Chitinophaga sp.]
MEPYLAMIIAFGGNFTINGWAMCWGQIMSIAQNSALFALLGTIYGGDGVQTFALPDLRGRAPIGWGQAPGLSNYEIGQKAGTENTTLLITNMPAHTHVADISKLTSTPSASTAAGTTTTPGSTLVPAMLPTIGSGPSGNPINGYAAQDGTATLSPNQVGGSITIGPTGGTQPFSIQNPYLAITYLIALNGIFPSRG